MAKVRFRLDRSEDGWPPADSEGLWAEPLGNGRYRLDNTPWFVRGSSADDVVSAVADEDGVLWFSQTLEFGGRQTIRVIPRSDGPLSGDSRAVLDAFSPLNVTGESLGEQLKIVALDLGPDVDVAAVKQLCIQGKTERWWHYEEGNVTPEWLGL
ncbi:uncharacterized protein DUF4265 [Isoptericola sp. CG 20/1183]|uniref:Uncharacterized protein DUF4265 n=1 Tax=Isoptericola halotolerans TaxID=300560 RepID=A0ABX5ED29_9MICO|nr:MULTISPECIES: DUF4265 domain-containing protein [Isoptericola]PRZ05706.1 uncharacterized protein DUF4265 [Isoptericola halotolerans]PRZ06274.1 uncharacterized protein DUF4265 [Isoptericola sp. CG 20/1183]